jgi:exosome complex component CSL4
MANQSGVDDCAVPGDLLGPLSIYTPGEGTYIRESSIYAAVAGFKKEISNGEEQKPTITVTRENERPSIVPALKSVVVGKVLKVNPRMATVSILVVGDKVLSEPFTGLIRPTDVRLTQIDQVELYKCFRPGDIVRAEVVSLGDSRSYYLSTAKNEYGVIFAKSMADATMVPISWNMMQCPKTKMKEFRKVAKTV